MTRDEEDRPTAFVAMRFDADHWRDETYQVMREELESAGYQVMRSDELRTSGPVVDEVCRLLREADLVVIDSTGDSHSVSYELGYCHGAGRPVETTLLLRNDGALPFNYRHFRHRIYKDKRHLRRLLRDYLDISEPFTDDMYGFTFVFEFSSTAHFGYIMDGAECIIDVLLGMEITGRCELYSGEQFSSDRRFAIGTLIRLSNGRIREQKTPDFQAWQKVMAEVTKRTAAFGGRITLDATSSELASKRALTASLLFSGGAEVTKGRIVRLLGVEGDGNFFAAYLRRKSDALGEGAPES